MLHGWDRVGLACSEIFLLAQGWLGGSGIWGLLLWIIFSFFVGDAARRIFARRDGFRHGLVMGG